MITEQWTREEVEDALAHYWEKDYFEARELDTIAFAENFFEYGYQNNLKSTRREIMEDLLEMLEDCSCNGIESEGEDGKTCLVLDENICAVLGKAILRTFTRRQVVTDALSFLARALEDGVDEAGVELSNWYAARLRSNDLANFEIADVGLTDLFNDEDFSRLTFPRDIGECRRRLVDCLEKLKNNEEVFVQLRPAFAALTGSELNLPLCWHEATAVLERFSGGVSAEARLASAKAMIEGAEGADAGKRIAEGAKIVRELAEKADLPDAWQYMLECHEKGVGPFKTNKFRRDAKAALARLGVLSDTIKQV